MKKIFGATLAASVFALMTAAFPGQADAGQMVVIDSTVPSLGAGTVIEGDKQIDLAAGQKVTLLSTDGSSKTLTGPYSGKPAEGSTASGEDSKMMGALSALFAQQKKSTASLGAVRSATSATAEIPVPSAWVVSVENSGDRCIRKGENKVVLWRKDASSDAKFSLELTGSLLKKKMPEAKWPAGRDRVALPGNFFSDNDTYKAKLDNNTVTLTFHTMPGDLDNPAQEAAWMASHGCTAQAMALLNNLR